MMLQVGDHRTVLRDGRWRSRRPTSRSSQTFAGRRTHAGFFLPLPGHDSRVTVPVLKRRQTRSAFAVTAASSEDSPASKDDPGEPEVVTSLADATPASPQEQDTLTEQSVPTEHEVVESRSFFAGYMPSQKVVVIAKNGVLLFLAVTFAISLFKTIRKFLSPKAKRKRTVNKNRELVEALVKYLPEKRDELTEKAVWMIRMKTGFTPTEVFRKYLWFVLRERKFDQSAVDDLIALKASLQLSENDVATALKERAQRIYEKYGSLMLNTEGMTSAGVERKATCQALFSKVLYLREHEHLLDPESEGAKELSLQEIFGATEEDESKLRIVSLEEVDLDKLDQMVEGNIPPEVQASDDQT